MASSNYSVTLHNLAPGATAAGLAYADVQLATVTPPQLRELLNAFSAVAAHLTIYEPSAPEIRVKTDQSVYVIRTRYRQLCLVGWETSMRGEEHTVGFILSTITGTMELIKSTPKVEPVHHTAPATHVHAPPAAGFHLPRWGKIGLLAALIIGLNVFTAWMLFRPPTSTVPAHTLLPETESRALLAKVAGEYETGNHEGDRRLIIDVDGTLHLAKFGAQRNLTEERTKTARPALVDGRASLITSDPSVLVIKDADTVVLYRTTYRRHRS
ncbi:MAG: hypothetical protein HYV95_04805 [Opitutae bacterium]|nr:hypothetical protein [Opitutae bacterium]